MISLRKKRENRKAGAQKFSEICKNRRANRKLARFAGFWYDFEKFMGRLVRSVDQGAGGVQDRRCPNLCCAARGVFLRSSREFKVGLPCHPARSRFSGTGAGPTAKKALCLREGTGGIALPVIG